MNKKLVKFILELQNNKIVDEQKIISFQPTKENSKPIFKFFGLYPQCVKVEVPISDD